MKDYKEETEKLIATITAKGVIEENEILLIKNSLTKGVIEFSEIEELFEANVFVSELQAAKGFNWLWNLYKSPIGKIRKNNPFCEYEIKKLENIMKEGLYQFQLVGFYNIGNYNSFYIPVYGLVGGGYNRLDYCVIRREIKKM